MLLLNSNYFTKDINYHNEIAPEYDWVVVEPRLAINNLVWEKAATRIRAGETMLDLGCGTGHATLRFSQYFKRCISVDHSDAMLSIAKRKILAADLSNVELINSEIIGFLGKQISNTVDAVFCIGVLHHLKQPEIVALLAEIRRVLRPHGQFVTSEPREIQHGSVPQSIIDWNATSIAPQLAYSKAVEETDEKPLSEPWLINIMYALGFTLDYIAHHYEIFPRTRAFSAAEQEEMKSLHEAHGFSGNALTVICHKDAL